jgi:sugar transferase (PEP-CTERM/EpsH1 system associated)
MKILFICHRFPYPPNRGGKIRPFQMIRHLGSRHSVIVASLAHSQGEMESGAALAECCDEVIAEVAPNRQRWLNAVTALPSHQPSSSAYFWSATLDRRIAAAASRFKPDVVWVHCAFMAQYALGIDSPLRIMDYGDLDSGKWLDYSEFRRFPLSLGFRLEASKLRQYEKRIASSFDRCTFTAPGELEEFESWGLESKCDLIPNGVDFDYFQYRPRVPESSMIVFVGRMDYFPNVQAAVEFTRNVFPRIRARVPAAQFRIVGSDPVRKVLELAREPGVTVTGSVPDVRPHLAEASVAVAPLKIARGTQNKILECMAVGVPMVSSLEASRGIQALEGEHFLVGRTDEQFAHHVVSLLENRQLRDRIALAARKQVERTHCWVRSMEIVDRLLEEERTKIYRSTSSAIGTRGS